MPEASTKKLTAEEFHDLPDDGRTLELSQGEVVEVTNGGGVHGSVGQRVNRALDRFVEEHGLGEVPMPGTGFKLDAHTVRKPDIAFIPTAVLPDPLPTGFYPFAPPLAVEVVSPNDTMRAVEEKAQEYLDAGTREVWIVSPFSRTVQVRPASGRPVILSGDDRLESPDLLPGFSVRVGDLFEG